MSRKDIYYPPLPAGVGSNQESILMAYARAVVKANCRRKDWRLVPIEPTPKMLAAMAMVDATGTTNGKPRLGIAGAVEAYE